MVKTKKNRKRVPKMTSEHINGLAAVIAAYIGRDWSKLKTLDKAMFEDAAIAALDTLLE